MGVARNAAKWRNMQQNQEMDMGAFYLCLIIAGFLSCGVAWLLIPLIAVLDADSKPRVSR